MCHPRPLFINFRTSKGAILQQIDVKNGPAGIRTRDLLQNIHPNGCYGDVYAHGPSSQPTACSGQSYKASMIVIYESRVVNTFKQFTSKYNSRVIIYARRRFIIFATGSRHTVFQL